MNGQPACLSRKAANATPKGEPESMILRSLCSLASKSFTSEVCLSAKTVDHTSRSRVRSGSKLMSTMKSENLRCLQKAAWSGLKPLGERDSHCACTSAGADRGEGEVGSRARDNKLQSTCTFVSSQPGIVRGVFSIFRSSASSAVQHVPHVQHPRSLQHLPQFSMFRMFNMFRCSACSACWWSAARRSRCPPFVGNPPISTPHWTCPAVRSQRPRTANPLPSPPPLASGPPLARGGFILI